MLKTKKKSEQLKKTILTRPFTVLPMTIISKTQKKQLIFIKILTYSIVLQQTKLFILRKQHDTAPPNYPNSTLLYTKLKILDI